MLRLLVADHQPGGQPEHAEDGSDQAPGVDVAVPTLGVVADPDPDQQSGEDQHDLQGVHRWPLTSAEYTAEAMTGSYDVAFLGGGMGGYVGAIRAAQLGLRTAVVEEDKLGGTCLHRGCIPTKALLQSAFVLDQARQGGRLGVRVSGVELDYAQVAKNRDQVVGQLHRGVEYLMKKNRIEVVRGRGHLEGPRRVRVGGGQSGDVEVEAGSMVIATGSRPKQVPGAEADGRVVLTSDHALALDHVPASAIVLGAGAVGVEFASFWRSCGAEVTVVEMLDRLVPLEDRAIGVELAKHFEARGIRCLVGATLDLGSIRRGEEGVEVSVTHAGEEQRLRAEVLLIAIGRTPNTEEIGLENPAVELERGFVRAGPDLRTAQEGVYAIGDVIGGFLLAHKGSHEGIIAAEVMAGGVPIHSTPTWSPGRPTAPPRSPRSGSPRRRLGPRATRSAPGSSAHRQRPLDHLGGAGLLQGRRRGRRQRPRRPHDRPRGHRAHLCRGAGRPARGHPVRDGQGHCPPSDRERDNHGGRAGGRGRADPHVSGRALLSVSRSRRPKPGAPSRLRNVAPFPRP